MQVVFVMTVMISSFRVICYWLVPGAATTALHVATTRTVDLERTTETALLPAQNVLLFTGGPIALRALHRYFPRCDPAYAEIGIGGPRHFRADGAVASVSASLRSMSASKRTVPHGQLT